MRLDGEGQLVRIFIRDSDQWHGKPLYEEIIKRMREEGIAGATVIRAIEGFGASSHLHTARILRLSEDLRTRRSTSNGSSRPSTRWSGMVS